MILLVDEAVAKERSRGYKAGWKGEGRRATFVIKSGPGGGLEKRLRSRVLGNEATGFAVTHSLPRYIAS